jgi:hypothetical protein
MTRISQTLLLGFCVVSPLLAGEAKNSPGGASKGFAWQSPVPDGCPFPKSTSLTGVFFTGRHSDYRCGDTWYPCWASDGNLYSPWTDGKTEEITCSSGEGAVAKTGHAVMIGDDPLRLTIRNTSPPKQASALPYNGRYPAGSLVYNAIWYYGTYCLGPDGSYKHNDFVWNWPNLGPLPGFQISRDYGKTWEPSPLTPEKPLFPEPRKFLGPVKMGAPHFVDFGENMEHSPDGKAYLLFFGVHKDAQTLQQILDPATFAGILISDDASVYAHFSQAQKCWAHLLRKAIKLTLECPHNTEYRRLADRLLDIYRTACRVQGDGRLSDAGRARKVDALEDEIVDLCGPVWFRVWSRK